MADDRALAAAIATAPSTVFRAFRTVTVRFVVANTQTEVLHLLGEIPDGFLTVNCGGVVKAEPGKQWTKDLAYLRCDTANVEAILVFVVLREAPRDVNPS